MLIDDFSFPLPEGLIALRPAPRRDGSRLMALAGGRPEHRRFHDLPEYLREGDMLLVNDSRVLPVRLAGRKETGGRLEVLLVRRIENAGGGTAAGELWEVLYRGRYSGRLRINDELEMELGEFLPGHEGCRAARLRFSGDLFEILSRCGAMPLPPYIKRTPDESDRERYQTVYCRSAAKDSAGRASGVFGSIAAPTAGLHFTSELLEAIRSKGVLVRSLTLHVGRGTFMPVKCRQVGEHRMEREYFEFDRGLIDEINETRRAGGRLCTVGTTATRAIEGYFSGRCELAAGGNGKISGTTDIFIHPGYRFGAVDMLVTNFHLPRSTPLMLAAALAGRQALLGAYEEAVSLGYRFFSYGDAMLIIDGRKCF
ncbi:MAG: tRNA preQ1(34) S-adenosylmethionine ribosyltransferase-isomerase QueA [Nitrospiraceae bacterium]|nr:tRNA preQ1(34) S-adenosylmethionine ribosyltransferase-isomerase QueA [Nitrospiraceae bacterium]